MTQKSIKTPGPDHPITVIANPARIVVRAAGRVIADTRKALTLREASYPPVQYIPRADADMALLTPSDHATYCPYKGDCSYLNLPDAQNAVWSYEHPYGAVAAIKGYLAFYPNKVEIEQRD